MLLICGQLSGPGSVCSGDTVTLTCNITGATTLQWFFGTTIEIIALDSTQNEFILGELPPVLRSGIVFTFSLVATSPMFISQLRFMPGDDQISFGVPVTCREQAGSGNFRETITTTVIASGKIYRTLQ